MAARDIIIIGYYTINGGYAAKNTVAVTYDGATRRGWVNGTATAGVAATGGTTEVTGQFIGKDLLTNVGFADYFNGQLYYVYIFGTAIPDADRIILTNV
jgi:hypothetical protein